MGQRFVACDREQPFLMPPDVREWLPPRHLAWFVIDAVQAAGNLLGNLLCGITGILNPTALANTPLAQLTQILNALLALSPRTPAPA